MCKIPFTLLRTQAVLFYRPLPLSVRKIRTFDRRKLTMEEDHIAVLGNSRLQLQLRSMRGTSTEGQFPFRAAHASYIAPGAMLRGFLYYHVSHPHTFLSGAVRFRCTPDPDPSSFPRGHDLPDRMGLPWGLPLPRILGRTKTLGLLGHQLVLDGLVSQEQLRKAQALLLYNPERVVPGKSLSRVHWVHALGQPFAIDLTVPLTVAVMGPHMLLRVTICPALMWRGGAIVCFERNDDPDIEEVVLRVLEPLPDYHDRLLPDYTTRDPPPDAAADYLPQFRHLPALRKGSLIPDPKGMGLTPWVWRYVVRSSSFRTAARIIPLMWSS
ncbi:hypothetical protein DFH06DRAFT_753777 [Mycena polygramma]|nr:hypothetical protein DFH06DRAFT_753777 [Mycena polygramma]